MTAPRLIFALVAALAGCSTGSGGVGGGYGSGGSGGFYVSGMGGSIGSAGAPGGSDAGVARDGGNPKSDASRGETLQPNLSADAPTFCWVSGTGSCASLGGSSGTGGRSGSGGSTGTSGAGGLAGFGGSVGSGGTTAARMGGAPSTGGQTSIGGATSMGGFLGSGGARASGGASGGRGGSIGSGGVASIDAGTASDASPLFTDASADFGSRDAGPDTSASPDALAGDLRPADSLPADTSTRCVVQIAAVLPVTDSFETFHLTAGSNVQVVLRASVVSGGPPAGVSWSWQANRDGTPLASTLGTQDPAAAAFPITSAGNYSFTAYDKTTGACSKTVQVSAVAANACAACDSSVILRAAPPASSDTSTDIPVQSGARSLSGSSPFSQTNIILDRGVAVQVSPRVGSNLQKSYVRISSVSGELTVDGLADPQTGGFSSRLLAVNSSLAVLKYDVLIVPIDDLSGGTVAATAPQLFQGLTANSINDTNTAFILAGGVKVTGTTVASTGPVSDVRVMLTNQDPSATQPNKLIFSSVGSSDASNGGSYLLHVQPGTYWVSISPPDGSGLPDALSPTAVTLTGDTTIDFKWNAVNTATLVLNVTDAAGNPSVGTRVRLTSAQANVVGTLTVGTNPQFANGNVQVENTTSTSGTVTFANLPDGVSYSALLVPATLGPYSATTAISVALPQGGGTQTVGLLAQGRINGRLVAGSKSTVDWSTVDVIAYDRSTDTPEAPLSVVAQKDGTFSLAVSPGRPYVVLVAPDVSSGLARTFIAPGPIQASEFTLTQNVQSSMPWSATVMDGSQVGVPGTALQVFCDVSWPGCVDPTVPLAETTSDDSGAFQLALPDPATR